MTANEQELAQAHRGWLGNLTEEHVGLVVTVPALLAAQAYFDKSELPELQQRFLELVPPLADKKTAREVQKALRARAGDDDDLVLDDPVALLTGLLGWPIERLAGAPGGPPLPDLTVRLTDFGDDRIEPTYALLDPNGAPLVLVRIEDVDLDRPLPAIGHRWAASPETRFERLLHERDVPIGLLINGAAVRLVYAPRTETTGHLTFPVSLMVQTAGREVLGAMVMLLRDTLLQGPTEHRLPAILRASRRYQNEVSNELAEQVMGALGDLLAGFQSARALSGERLLAHELAEDPAHIYGGLLATLMRLVFLLYAEDRGLLPTDEIFAGGYSIAGLYERLRDDDARYHETMDQRYGAWAQILSLFSMIFFGARHRTLRLPARLGELFDPNAYAFLEGRAYRDVRGEHDRIDPPRVSDGTVLRVLHQLLYLEPKGKGVRERISYRSLDVEQIGSVYEAMMGYTLESAGGPSICLRPHHAVVGLAELLARKPDERLKLLAEVDCKPSGTAATEVKKAGSVEALAAALQKSVSPRRPGVLPAGTLYLQPTEERRRSGSHYTPRELTKPIVEKTLAPLLSRLQEKEGGARAAEILELKLCDPAMGSGAFLVEACRQLADAVVEAWKRWPKDKPIIPPDETEELCAMRLVAQRCIYGVDKNPFAVALAKLSLWLVTLAKDHPFTFLDHALREGDSLVGLTREQIASFSWAPGKQVPLLRKVVDESIQEAERLRAQIHALAESDDTGEKLRLLRDADSVLAQVRKAGDLVVECFFGETKEKARQKRLEEYTKGLQVELSAVREPDLGALRPFHWEIEFPEVFSRKNPGFDAFVGNPPFLGGTRISVANGIAYRDWLAEKHQSSSLTDLVAYFFRRTFELLREGGCCGLVATNSIAQGDTRTTGLTWICTHGGTLYDVTRRLRWPGLAAVVVSILHFSKGSGPRKNYLDGRRVDRITAFLFHAGGHESPVMLKANRGISVIGSFVLGIGFVFEDGNSEATPIEEMHRLIQRDPRNRERICSYVGGEDLNTNPTQTSDRFIIDFGDMPEADARRWPDLMAIIEAKVKPARQSVAQRDRRELWWLHATRSPEQKRYVASHGRCLAISQVSQHLAFSFVSAGVTFSHTVVLILLSKNSALAILQSRPHEFWARFFGSSLEDRLRYTPTDCFETFPFPPAWEQNAALEAAGKDYYDFRAALMVANNQGLTATYNRFHDPDEQDPEILKLRALHDAMDRAVLDAYGWTDLQPTCTFLLDYEEDEETADQPGKPRRKKPWRYRWPDDVRDEVLARLLALNQARAEEERRAAKERKA
ncbi:Eco57I restriction-modification methylase domain-containing protein [Sorangium sp. So ce513]|uniref:Eco57I restriction-modification methylase domain-containing protein n=1 Tax=Sorangium sp. So ce513 TaxID=3133315 RepID=UPI003F60A90F